MLQYILNASAIWLISLVLFDVFLRRESYHSYNRLYLLFTFILGLVFPLITWGSSTYEMGRAIVALPVDRVAVTQQTVANIVATAASHASETHINWWLAGYVAGVAVAFVTLIMDSFKLVKFYRKGVKTIENGYTIIETGSTHTPFSFLNRVFVGNRGNYTVTEWQTVMAHELRHASLLHVIDVCIMQLARIVFWFHPLVYAYNKRLLTVHEYQADQVATIEPLQYGRFLIEQAILNAAPTITHSLNRSPIKNRILMLTNRSTTIAKFKTLVFIPLVLVSFLCFSQNAGKKTYQPNQYGTIIFGENRPEYSATKFDDVAAGGSTAAWQDHFTKEASTRKISSVPHMIKMNGQTIQRENYWSKPNDWVMPAMYKKIKNELLALEDGYYYLGIKDLIVDVNGQICAFTYERILGLKTVPNSSPIEERPFLQVNAQVEEKIFNKMCAELAGLPKLAPTVINNKKVVSVNSLFGDWCAYSVKVQNHKLYCATKEAWVEL